MQGWSVVCQDEIFPFWHAAIYWAFLRLAGGDVHIGIPCPKEKGIRMWVSGCLVKVRSR